MRRRARRIAGALVAVATVGGSAAALAGRVGGRPAVATAGGPATTVVAVERRDLVVSDTYDGRLGYGDSRDVETDREGVVTTVPSVGATVQPGGALFSVDLEPTILLTGAVPSFRALSTSSSDGADVAQLEQALVALGHGAGLTVDDEFDAATAAAVEAWEEALGRDDPDGVVALGDVAFAAGPLRIHSVVADVGSRVQPGDAVVATTPTAHVVTASVDADRAGALEPGTAVRLELPDRTSTTGTVERIGSEAEEAEGAPGTGPTVSVVIALDDPAAASGFDTASVEVSVERSRHEGALAVPVTALLALAEGGYALEVVDPSAAAGRRLVEVDTGTFAEGWVGVSGAGIEPGVRVVAPA